MNLFHVNVASSYVSSWFCPFPFVFIIQTCLKLCFTKATMILAVKFHIVVVVVTCADTVTSRRVV